MIRSAIISVASVAFICTIITLSSCKKKAAVPSLVTSDVTDITETTASAGGNITDDGNSEITSRGICWATSENPTTQDNYSDAGSGTGSFTTIMSGLNPGTSYHTRAYAANVVGTSYGSDRQFNTLVAGGNIDTSLNGNNASNLIIENQSFTNSSDNWSGVVIPHSTRVSLLFRYNLITSVNSEGYMLQAGDEAPGNSNNKLDGGSITGNRFTWNGIDKASTITHGIFLGYNINCIIKYNYLFRVPSGIILKSNGMTNSTGGVSYNIISRSGNIGVVIKGINNVFVYNNTFYSDEVKYTSDSNPGTDYGIVDIFANDGLSPRAYSKGAKIKNNIFYTVHQIPNISIEDSQDLEGFESDFNIFWCEAGSPIFKYLGVEKTFSQWQALGYDTHSIVLNPNFSDFTDFVPASRLDYGTDLGSGWQTGLSVTAKWITGSAPGTTVQNGHWQVGARVR
jgi:hypothetical protein